MLSEVDRYQPTVEGLAAVIVAAEGYRLAAADHFDLDVSETHVISYLNIHGPLSQSQLARLMGLSTGAVTGLVDRLERRGTARRVPDPDDRRRNRVELTDRSRTIVADSDAALAHVFHDLPDDVVQTLSTTLPLIAQGLRRESARLVARRDPGPAADPVASLAR